MAKYDNEKLLDKAENKFVLSIAAAKRARQLKDGAVPLVEAAGRPDLIVALDEIMQGKVEIDQLVKKDTTPEIIAG